MLLLFLFLTFTVIFTAISTSGRRWKKLPQRSLTHILVNNHQRAYLFIADGKVAWGRLGKSISLNSGFAYEIASLNFDSFDQNRKETR